MRTAARVLAAAERGEQAGEQAAGRGASASLLPRRHRARGEGPSAVRARLLQPSCPSETTTCGPARGGGVGAAAPEAAGAAAALRGSADAGRLRKDGRLLRPRVPARLCRGRGAHPAGEGGRPRGAAPPRAHRRRGAAAPRRSAPARHPLPARRDREARAPPLHACALGRPRRWARAARPAPALPPAARRVPRQAPGGGTALPSLPPAPRLRQRHAARGRIGRRRGGGRARLLRPLPTLRRPASPAAQRRRHRGGER
mmetsp:Transcript_33397/g.107459  ORF Transcript_33397/g.107459 Transcript_33397/m.107459 type:complete len:257 (+) Transcript_33397:56-826(+)